MTAGPATAPGRSAASAAGGGLARSGFISFTGALVAAVLGFALTVVVGRTLGAAGSGLFFAVAALFFIISNAVELGADTALVWALPRLRALGRTSELRSTVRIALRPVWIASTLSAAAVLIAAPLLADVLVDARQHDQTVLVLRLVAPFLLVAAPLAVALAGTRALGSVVPYTVVGSIGVPLARPLLVLAVAAVGLGTAAVVLAWAAPLAVAAGVALCLLSRQLHRVERATDGPGALAPRPVREQAREFWRYATPRCFSAILEIALVWTDVLLVTALSTTALAGIYAAASRFITSGTLVESALRVALGPRLSAQLAVGERAAAERLHRAACIGIAALSWPIYLPLAVFSPVVLGLFGHEFVAGSTALTILALAMSVRMLAGLSQTVLLMSGNSRWQLADKVLALSANVVLNVLLVPPYGIKGAAIAWAGALLLDALAAVVQVRHVVRLRFPVRRLVVVSAVALACYGVGGLGARSVAGASVSMLLAYLALATAVYASSLWLLRERLGLTELLPRRRAA